MELVGSSPRRCCSAVDLRTLAAGSCTSCGGGGGGGGGAMRRRCGELVVDVTTGAIPEAGSKSGSRSG